MARPGKVPEEHYRKPTSLENPVLGKEVSSRGKNSSSCQERRVLCTVPGEWAVLDKLPPVLPTHK